MSKYKNIKAMTSDGRIHDSRKEARRWAELKLLERGGLIKELHSQVRYELIPPQYEVFERYGKRGQKLSDGKKLLERGVDYIADFVYVDVKTGQKVVEDTKGVRTKEYIIKRKLMLFKYGIKISEI